MGYFLKRSFATAFIEELCFEAGVVAKRRRYHASKLAEHRGAYPKFPEEFLDRHVGFSCAVCYRLECNLMAIGNVRDVAKRERQIC